MTRSKITTVRDRMRGRYSKMLARCYNPNDKHFNRYGGRGIGVCARWRKSFDAYLSDVGHPPFDGAQLDRIDNNAGYFPENMRWATSTENNNNRENNVSVTYDGRTLTLQQWSRETGIPRQTLFNRLAKGWSLEDVFSPVSKRPKLGGVTWHKPRKKWLALIYKNDKKYYLGLFVDWFEAVCARKSAEVDLDRALTNRVYARHQNIVSGVQWNKKNQRWHARIADKHVGSFEDWFEAVCARKSAEVRHG